MSVTIPRAETARLSIPRLGLGTWRLAGAEGQAAIEGGIALGYRHLDTAEMYGNEVEVGAAMAASGVAREELFLTSKVWHDHLAPEAMRAAIEGSLGKLKTPYLDLFLVHWPSPEMDLDGTMRTLRQLQEEGLTRAIGVANFPAGMLRRALDTGAPLACVQVEYHVNLSQERLLAVTRPAEMVLTAYSPLGKGGLVDDPTLARVGARHGATGAQVALAWLLRQKGVAAIPKASRPESQTANLQAVPLAQQLTAEDLAELDALPKDRRFVNPAGFAPNWED
ncbi:aldo/keto reductase [Roseomonas sp. BN140053]|uniref:aldo/keto reductase n=1 Tax=Roseomonas sp. BN140053 TaxID=3391898 RepID=UPI0039E78805